jgi:hypothetical protein
MDYWFVWKFQRRLIGIRDAFPSAEKGVGIETPDATGLISRDHAIVRLIQSSKVDKIGEKTRLVEQSPELWDLKGGCPRMGRHDP